MCREIWQSSQVPIIVLTGRNIDFDELMSLNIGADDFVSKPYNAQVLLSQIQKLLSRASEAQDSVALTLNLLKAEISYNGQNKNPYSKPLILAVCHFHRQAGNYLESGELRGNHAVSTKNHVVLSNIKLYQRQRLYR